MLITAGGAILKERTGSWSTIFYICGVCQLLAGLFFGAFAEKMGDRRAIVLGALLYATGLVLTTGASSPFAMQFYEVLVARKVLAEAPSAPARPRAERDAS